MGLERARTPHGPATPHPALGSMMFVGTQAPDGSLLTLMLEGVNVLPWVEEFQWGVSSSGQPMVQVQLQADVVLHQISVHGSN